MSPYPTGDPGGGTRLRLSAARCPAAIALACVMAVAATGCPGAPPGSPAPPASSPTANKRAGGPGSGGPGSYDDADELFGEDGTPVVSTWVKNYHASATDPNGFALGDFMPSEIHETGDGGLVLVGTVGNESGDTDAWVMRMDGFGNVIWSNAYGLPGGRSPFREVGGVAASGDGGFYVTGVNAARLPIAAKINGDGAVEWITVLGDTQDLPMVISRGVQGGLFVGGVTKGTNLRHRPWIVRLGGAGDLRWEKIIFQAEDDQWEEVLDLVPTSDGGVVAVGNMQQNVVGLEVALGKRGILYKLNEGGTLVNSFAQGIESDDDTEYTAARRDEDGGVVVVGHDVEDNRPFIRKLPAEDWDVSTSGESQDASDESWTITDSDIVGRLYAIDLTRDRGFVVGGWRESRFVKRAWIGKYGANQEIVWSHFLETGTGLAEDTVGSIERLADGGFLIGTNRAVFEIASDGVTENVWDLEDLGLHPSPNPVTPPSGGALEPPDKLRMVPADPAGRIDGGFAILLLEQTTFYWGPLPLEDTQFLVTDTDGAVLWTLGGSAPESAQSIAETADGGFIVVGKVSNLTGGGPAPAWLFRVDINGQVVWQRRALPNDTSGGYLAVLDGEHAVRSTSDGNFIVSGGTRGYGDWVMKMDGDARTEWAVNISGAGPLTDVMTLEDGSSLLSGYATTRLDPDGELISSYEYDYFHEFRFILDGDKLQTRLEPAADGGYFIMPRTWQELGPVIKIGPDGQPEWETRLMNFYRSPLGAGTTPSVHGVSVQGTPDGGCVVALDTRLEGDGNECIDGLPCSNFWIIKLDAQGEIEWQKTYSTAGTDLVSDITRTRTGGYVIAGYSDGFSHPFHDAWILKIGARGKIAPSCPAGLAEPAIYGEARLDPNWTTLPSEISVTQYTLPLSSAGSAPMAPIEMESGRSCSGESSSDLDVDDYDEPEYEPEPPVAACGDGRMDAGEECDDGNVVDGDGCDSACTNEVTFGRSPNNLSLTWPVDLEQAPNPVLALSPNESLFVGVAHLEGTYDIRWPVEPVTVDPRGACDPCAEPTITSDKRPEEDNPDGAIIGPAAGDGLHVGTWELTVQIYNTRTNENWLGYEVIEIQVDPGAFQLIRESNWQDITLSLFGDMPGASRTDPVGGCDAGRAEWTLALIDGPVVATECIVIDDLDAEAYYDWPITGLEEGAYTATIRYVDGTSNLGAILWERSFRVIAPIE